MNPRTKRTSVLIVVVSALLLGSTVALVGGALGTSGSEDAAMASQDTNACDGSENASLPGNCDVSLTVVPYGIDSDDGLAGYVVRNDGSGESIDDLENVTYETSLSESGTVKETFLLVNVTENESVNLQVYYEGDLAVETDEVPSTEMEFDPADDRYTANETDESADDSTEDDGNPDCQLSS